MIDLILKKSTIIKKKKKKLKEINFSLYTKTQFIINWNTKLVI